MDEFVEYSPMLYMARMNMELLAKVWDGLSDVHILAKPFFLPIVLLHSVLCLFFAAFFGVACVLDVIPYLIRIMAEGLRDKAEDLADDANMGFWETAFYPLAVFALCLLLAVVVLLPKAIKMGDEA